MRKWSIVSVVAVIVILIDQFTKTWVVNNLALGESIRPIPALYPLFQITRSFNTGAAFGILPDSGILFLFLPIIVVGILLYMFRKEPPDLILAPIAIGMVIGGAIGNLLDRFQYDLVIDFIHYQIPGVISNVSNIADHGVVLGVIILLVNSWWRERQADKLEENEGDISPDIPLNDVDSL